MIRRFKYSLRMAWSLFGGFRKHRTCLWTAVGKLLNHSCQCRVVCWPVEAGVCMGRHMHETAGPLQQVGSAHAGTRTCSVRQHKREAGSWSRAWHDASSAWVTAWTAWAATFQFTLAPPKNMFTSSPSHTPTSKPGAHGSHACPCSCTRSTASGQGQARQRLRQLLVQLGGVPMVRGVHVCKAHLRTHRGTRMHVAGHVGQGGV